MVVQSLLLCAVYVLQRYVFYFKRATKINEYFLLPHRYKLSWGGVGVCFAWLCCCSLFAVALWLLLFYLFD